MASLQDAQLPSWARVGARCRYYSESQKTIHPVIVTSIENVKRRIVVHFEADHRIWKTIPFNFAGRNGVLRPPDSNAPGFFEIPAATAFAAQAMQAEEFARSKDKDGLTAREKQDGTSTPPWYEMMMSDPKEEEVQKKRQDELLAQQERRRYAWMEAKRRQAEEDQQAREMERIKKEEDAEAERILIVQKLQREREEEERRQFEVRRMHLADEACIKVNGVWRQRDLVRQRQLQEERDAEEVEARRLAEEQFQRELAARPRVSFGVKKQQEPQKVHIPQEVPKESQKLHIPHAQYTGDDKLNGVQLARHPSDALSTPEHEAQDDLDGEPIDAEPRVVREPPATSRWDAVRAAAPPAKPAAAPPRPSASAPSQAPAVATPSRVPVRPPPNHIYATPTEWYGAHIRAIYEVHNSAKLADVPSLLEKYAGCEAEMYSRICGKYGVEPEPAPQFQRASERSRSRTKPSKKNGQATPSSSEPLLPGLGVVPKASAGQPGVGYARKASAPMPPQVAKASRPVPSSAVREAPVPSSAPDTSTLLARLNNLLGKKPAAEQESDADDSPSDGSHHELPDRAVPSLASDAAVHAPSPTPQSRGDVGAWSRSRSCSRCRAQEESPQSHGERGLPRYAQERFPAEALQQRYGWGRESDDGGREKEYEGSQQCSYGGGRSSNAYAEAREPLSRRGRPPWEHGGSNEGSPKGRPPWEHGGSNEGSPKGHKDSSYAREWEHNRRDHGNHYPPVGATPDRDRSRDDRGRDPPWGATPERGRSRDERNTLPRRSAGGWRRDTDGRDDGDQRRFDNRSDGHRGARGSGHRDNRSSYAGY